MWLGTAILYTNFMALTKQEFVQVAFLCPSLTTQVGCLG
jgi:hypothetical protein